jgi:hypothetical protein
MDRGNVKRRVRPDQNFSAPSRTEDVGDVLPDIWRHLNHGFGAGSCVARRPGSHIERQPHAREP